MKDFDILLQVHKINITYHGVYRGVEQWEAALRDGTANGWTLQNVIEPTPRAAVLKLLDKCGRSSRVRLRDRLKLWALKWVRPVVVTLLLLLPLSLWAQAQERKPQPLMRVLLAPTEDGRTDVELNGHLRGELGKLRSVALTSRRTDYSVTAVSTAITRGDDAEVVGYAVAVLVVRLDTGRFKLMIDTGPTLQGIAARVASRLQKEVFTTNIQKGK